MEFLPPQTCCIRKLKEFERFATTLSHDNKDLNNKNRLQEQSLITMEI